MDKTMIKKQIDENNEKELGEKIYVISPPIILFIILGSFLFFAGAFLLYERFILEKTVVYMRNNSPVPDWIILFSGICSITIAIMLLINAFCLNIKKIIIYNYGITIGKEIISFYNLKQVEVITGVLIAIKFVKKDGQILKRKFVGLKPKDKALLLKINKIL